MADEMIMHETPAGTITRDRLGRFVVDMTGPSAPFTCEDLATAQVAFKMAEQLAAQPFFGPVVDGVAKAPCGCEVEFIGDAGDLDISACGHAHYEWIEARWTEEVRAFFKEVLS